MPCFWLTWKTTCIFWKITSGTVHLSKKALCIAPTTLTKQCWSKKFFITSYIVIIDIQSFPFPKWCLRYGLRTRDCCASLHIFHPTMKFIKQTKTMSSACKILHTIYDNLHVFYHVFLRILLHTFCLWIKADLHAWNTDVMLHFLWLVLWRGLTTFNLFL